MRSFSAPVIAAAEMIAAPTVKTAFQPTQLANLLAFSHAEIPADAAPTRSAVRMAALATDPAAVVRFGVGFRDGSRVA